MYRVSGAMSSDSSECLWCTANAGQRARAAAERLAGDSASASEDSSEDAHVHAEAEAELSDAVAELEAVLVCDAGAAEEGSGVADVAAAEMSAARVATARP